MESKLKKLLLNQQIIRNLTDRGRPEFHPLTRTCPTTTAETTALIHA